jgi:hypothetical protein
MAQSCHPAAAFSELVPDAEAAGEPDARVRPAHRRPVEVEAQAGCPPVAVVGVPGAEVERGVDDDSDSGLIARALRSSATCAASAPTRACRKHWFPLRSRDRSCRPAATKLTTHHAKPSAHRRWRGGRPIACRENGGTAIPAGDASHAASRRPRAPSPGEAARSPALKVTARAGTRGASSSRAVITAMCRRVVSELDSVRARQHRGHVGSDHRTVARRARVTAPKGGPVTDEHFRNRVWYPAVAAAWVSTKNPPDQACWQP